MQDEKLTKQQLQEQLVGPGFEAVNIVPRRKRKNEAKEEVYDFTYTRRRTQPKTGRNDLCPCGSGKKYKKCCITKEV